MSIGPNPTPHVAKRLLAWRARLPAQQRPVYDLVMDKCICTSLKHGHGEQACGKPAVGDFCQDCMTQMDADKQAGEEAYDRQSEETTGRVD